jgi:SAM-dependent methyltransferase
VVKIQAKINLACGGVFVTGDNWINIDYSRAGSNVRSADLLAPLPLPDNGATLVYSSHFLEHIPRCEVPSFLGQCWRVLAPGGVLRIVLPDLENICRTYLAHRDLGEHEKADFVVLEMIDQCVRRDSGGELGRLYRTLKANPRDNSTLIDFVRERTGDDLLRRSLSRDTESSGGGRLARRVQRRIERLWTDIVLNLLPTAFRAQNVSLAGVGERHHWMWDFHQLRQVLEGVGFAEIGRCEATSSRFIDFPFHPLDLDVAGHPRKGAESMYIEALKPG